MRAAARAAHISRDFHAQTRPDHRRLALSAAGTPARRAIEGGPAPYDGDLQRLAEILGALHYLRGICGANEGQKWRNEMQALLDAEAPSGDRRNRLQVRFNRGYRGFQQTYRTCTPAADLVDPPLSRRRRQDLPRDHRALFQLGAARSGRYPSADPLPHLQAIRSHPFAGQSLLACFTQATNRASSSWSSSWMSR